MLYSWDITVPANTTVADPVRQDLKLGYGVVSQVTVLFPPGCARLVHLRIFRGANQIWPSTSDQDLSGDTFPIEWPEYYELVNHPFVVVARLWNEDDTYEHTVTIRIAVLPRKAVVAYALADALSRLFSVLSPRRLFTGGG